MITNAEVIQVLSVFWAITVYFIKCIPAIGILYAIGYFMNIQHKDKQRQNIAHCSKLLDEIFLNMDEITVELRGSTYKIDQERLIAAVKPNFKLLTEVSDRLKSLC